MTHAFVCDAVRTPIGRFGGALASLRTDDLAAHPIAALMARNPGLDWAALDDVYLGCATQAGEDDRNVAPMAGPTPRPPGARPGPPGAPAAGGGSGRDRRRPRLGRRSAGAQRR